MLFYIVQKSLLTCLFMNPEIFFLFIYCVRHRTETQEICGFLMLIGREISNVLFYKETTLHVADREGTVKTPKKECCILLFYNQAETYPIKRVIVSWNCS